MTELGKYELHEQLGKGGFGTVYRATDTTLGRDVALKVLHPQLTIDPDFLEKFREEARLVSALGSPNIVTIHELGEEEGRTFIAMSYMSGGSLAQRLEKQKTIPLSEALKVIKQTCNGLRLAHRKGLVHRDIKPGNILFDEEGNAVIGDFGLARAIQKSSDSVRSSYGGVGTPSYRPPELWEGKPPADESTDIYSLGCVLSEMLTGEKLFDGDTTNEIITKHLAKPPQISKDLSPEVAALLEKALAKKQADRYQSALSFSAAASLAEAELEKRQGHENKYHALVVEAQSRMEELETDIQELEKKEAKTRSDEKSGKLTTRIMALKRDLGEIEAEIQRLRRGEPAESITSIEVPVVTSTPVPNPPVRGRTPAWIVGIGVLAIVFTIGFFWIQNGQAQRNFVYDAPEPTATRVPTRASTNTPRARTSTPQIRVVSSNTANCTNSAAFVSETVPDGSTISAGATFTKTWRVKNTGTCSWNMSYGIQYDEGMQLGGDNFFPIPNVVKPGDQVDFTISLKAPISSGTYLCYYKLISDYGEGFGDRLYFKISVPGTKKSKYD